MEIKLPLNNELIASLNAGDMVNLSGKIMTARDAAHQKLVDSINRGEELPVDLKDQLIFYSGPITDPLDPDKIISIGPTTSYRMDDLTIPLLKQGVKGFIGKGQRAEFIDTALQDFQAVYFMAVGGIAALLADHITASKVIAYPELGTEAVRELTISAFPVIVASDARGNNIFHEELR